MLLSIWQIEQQMILRHKNIAMPKNAPPHEPEWSAIAASDNSIPVNPEPYASEVRIIKAVAEHTSNVSKNTPNPWINPCLAGWETDAVAAAIGSPPIPAPLKKSPLVTSLIIAAVIPPPTTYSIPKALLKINDKTCGIFVMLVITVITTKTARRI